MNQNKAKEIKKLPSQEYLNECFNYNPETGSLTWKVRPDNHFKGSQKCNSNLTNTEAGYLNNGTGSKSKYVCISGRTLAVHRVIWKLVTGNEPSGSIIHINKKADDNRWVNLMEFNNHLGISHKEVTGVTNIADKDNNIGIYVILFSNNTVKMGQSNMVLHRIYQHQHNAKCFSIEVTDSFYLLFDKSHLNKIEKLLCNNASKFGEQGASKEWILNADYPAIKQLLQNIHDEYMSK